MTKLLFLIAKQIVIGIVLITMVNSNKIGTNLDNKKSDLGFNFNPKTLNIETVSNWSISVYLTGISPSNDQRQHAVIVYDISEVIVKHGDNKWTANFYLGNSENVSMYTEEPINFYREIRKTITSENNTVKTDLLVSNTEIIMCNVDFSNLSIPSVFDYNATILTQISITYPSNKNVEDINLEDHSNYVDSLRENLLLIGDFNRINDGFQCDSSGCSSDIDTLIQYEYFPLIEDIQSVSVKSIQTKTGHKQDVTKDTTTLVYNTEMIIRLVMSIHYNDTILDDLSNYN
ncbi:unnamed protein product [Phyllotreta striolata]|uniref:Endonuclease/exonuclease/phosphatase domain-containing protein n=1 Tax=Phyllotreta striolata TaxID=444603 RepID=A0A9N9XNG8_PHYSR|nr:unnamed protein product [Phyllotreta striolata]